MRRTIWIVLLTMFAGIAWAAEISIAGFLPDPGFERKHEPNAQLNAEGVKEIHGWSARPEKGNPWTSVSYVDRGGRSESALLRSNPPRETVICGCSPSNRAAGSFWRRRSSR